MLAIYREIETGKTADRPELARAIAHANRSGATLVVAKLDRLARNAAFLLTLQASGLPMVFLDLPGANEFTVGVMALVAQHEARMISERTKAALAAYKRRGGLLGGSRRECRNLTQAGRKRGARASGAGRRANGQRSLRRSVAGPDRLEGRRLVATGHCRRIEPARPHHATRQAVEPGPGHARIGPCVRDGAQPGMVEGPREGHNGAMRIFTPVSWPTIPLPGPQPTSKSAPKHPMCGQLLA